MDLSIVIPSKDTPVDLLTRAVSSVVRSVEASFDYEIVIVDDCSHEPIKLEQLTRSVDCAANIKIVRRSRSTGIGDARNCGAAIATGNFISFIDSDDMLKDGAMLKMMSAIRASRDQIVFADHDVFRETEDLSFVRRKESWLRLFETFRHTAHSPVFYCNFIVLPILLSRRLFARSGGYPSAGHAGEHVGLYARLAGNHEVEFVHVPESLYEYRMRTLSHSKSNPESHHQHKGNQLSVSISKAGFGHTRYSGKYFRCDQQPTVYLPILNGSLHAPKWAECDESSGVWQHISTAMAQ